MWRAASTAVCVDGVRVYPERGVIAPVIVLVDAMSSIEDGVETAAMTRLL